MGSPPSAIRSSSPPEQDYSTDRGALSALGCHSAVKGARPAPAGRSVTSVASCRPRTPRRYRPGRPARGHVGVQPAGRSQGIGNRRWTASRAGSPRLSFPSRARKRAGRRSEGAQRRVLEGGQMPKPAWPGGRGRGEPPGDRPCAQDVERLALARAQAERRSSRRRRTRRRPAREASGPRRASARGSGHLFLERRPLRSWLVPPTYTWPSSRSTKRNGAAAATRSAAKRVGGLQGQDAAPGSSPARREAGSEEGPP